MLKLNKVKYGKLMFCTPNFRSAPSVGQSIALENRSRGSVLTPSLARIADKDCVVELRGLSSPLFKAGAGLNSGVDRFR